MSDADKPDPKDYPDSPNAYAAAVCKWQAGQRGQFISPLPDGPIETDVPVRPANG